MTNTSQVKTSLIPWDNPHDLLSHRDYLLAAFILSCVVKPVVVAVGLPSNIINCVVFWRQGLQDRMNVCLLALSVADLGLITVTALFSVSYYLEQIDPVTYEGLFAYFQTYIAGVGQGFRTASGCITMVIAVERCLCVMFPLKAASLISTRNMSVVMVFIGCFSQVAFFTMPARFVIIKVNSTTSKMGPVSSDLYLKNQVFFTILENIVMMSVVPIATFLIISLSTGLTVVKLRAAMDWRRKFGSSSDESRSQHTAVTKMLVLVSSVYIVTTIPWVIFYLASLTVQEFSLTGQFYNLYMTSIVAVYHLPYINSSVGFFVYFNRSTRFRKDVLDTCGGSCKVQSGLGREVKTVSKALNYL
ncbi:uncharacterized protein LOC112577299 [Pomacea canaliculata]|uniref:uncharacterized protein LOC112577299 n=1 Tax=Pomacea canaliculata TaxID=400727 RepID=UPI000D72E2C9|nr:uncharacterized protein LOC112577299 [Pomacea canaliculata]